MDLLEYSLQDDNIQNVHFTSGWAETQTFGKGEADISVCSVIGKCELGSISYDVGISEYVH